LEKQEIAEGVCGLFGDGLAINCNGSRQRKSIQTKQAKQKTINKE
jgi:hypothetical protein